MAKSPPTSVRPTQPPRNNNKKGLATTALLSLLYQISLAALSLHFSPRTSQPLALCLTYTALAAAASMAGLVGILKSRPLPSQIFAHSLLLDAQLATAARLLLLVFSARWAPGFCSRAVEYSHHLQLQLQREAQLQPQPQESEKSRWAPDLTLGGCETGAWCVGVVACAAVVAMGVLQARLAVRVHWFANEVGREERGGSEAEEAEGGLGAAESHAGFRSEKSGFVG